MTGQSAQHYRLPVGGRIDRGQPVRFRFDGELLTGFVGDTLASALLANGRLLVGRSFKYHRPRGIVGLGAEEPNGIVQVGQGSTTVPNLRATQVELFDGLEAQSVNRWPSLRYDAGAINGFLSPLLPAGFYYKTFMWPASAWPFYERFIRRAAGLGRAPADVDPDNYDKRNRHCDVLVIGGGPAGLAAALAAGRTGARVILCDEQPTLGGSLHNADVRIDGAAAQDWVMSAERELRALNDVLVLSRTTATGYYDHNFVTLVERGPRHAGGTLGANEVRERLWRIRARHVIVAAGAFERPLLFANNDRPGVMLASAVSGYLNRYAVLPTKQAVVATNNDSGYATARELRRAGVSTLVLDSRPTSGAADRLRDEGADVRTSTVIASASGRRRVTGVEVTTERGEEHIACDLVAVSGGWNPAIHLHAQSGGRSTFDERLQTFLPTTVVQSMRSAGACAGEFSTLACLQAGAFAGNEAASAAGFAGDLPRFEVGRDSDEFVAGEGVLSDTANPRRGKTFVDFQNDTATSDLRLAVQEGFESVEHVKRYTALGFGTDQGKLGNVSGATLVAAALNKDVNAVGTTTFRPPYSPVTFGAVAGLTTGSLFEPVRKTALHAWHEEAGAVFEPVGQWMRPYFYPAPGETMDEAVNRECLAVRHRVGVMDASTLGKIEVFGADAPEFLNRVYTNGWLKLPIGRSRYGLMLGEDGMVMDDGVTTRLDDHHFFMTTTTGGAANVLAWLERWHQTEWPHLDVGFVSVTDQIATIAVAGPRSRDVLEQVAPSIDFSREAFPFMANRFGETAGVAARVARISFSGELAFEVNIPANAARHVWEAIVKAGQPYEITPYGTETMHVLRAEKGYIIVGQDTDGSVTPQDLGLGGMCARAKDFIGKRSLARADTLREDRKQLVGLRTQDPNTVLLEGAQLVSNSFTRLPVAMEGHVTSSYWSAALGHSIALALLIRGHQRHGERVFIPHASGELIEARVTAPVFYDPDGVRQDGDPNDQDGGK